MMTWSFHQMATSSAAFVELYHMRSHTVMASSGVKHFIECHELASISSKGMSVINWHQFRQHIK